MSVRREKYVTPEEKRSYALSLPHPVIKEAEKERVYIRSFHVAYYHVISRVLREVTLADKVEQSYRIDRSLVPFTFAEKRNRFPTGAEFSVSLARKTKQNETKTVL